MKHEKSFSKILPYAVLLACGGGGGSSSTPTPISNEILTVAGDHLDDGLQAIDAFINDPQGVAIDSSGNIFIADYSSNHIRKVNTSGVISTVAGNGTGGSSGDGNAATSAELYLLESVA